MKIAVYPFAASGSVADNFAAIRRRIEAARRSGVRLLVFQECALSGYPPVEVDEIEKIDFRANDACIRDVKAIAKESDMFIALGSVRESSGSYYNSIVLFGPDGEILGTYDKRALWGWDRENFTLGESDGIFRIVRFLKESGFWVWKALQQMSSVRSSPTSSEMARSWSWVRLAVVT